MDSTVTSVADSVTGPKHAAGEPIARVALGSGAPAELIRTLAAFGIEPVAGACEKPVDLRVDFGTGANALASVAVAELTAAPAATALLKPGDAPFAVGNGEFSCDNPLAAACFILSRALGLIVPLLTANGPMLSVISAALKAARNRGRILVEGETGSGKEALVRLIRRAGHREREFLYVDCAVLDESFGAFALSDPNAAEPPRPRTLFLNHIGELPLRAQLRLAAAMRANVEDAAGTNANESRMRYIAVANHPAAAAARHALTPELRELFDTTLAIPPLRARTADIPLLARHFLRAINPAMSFAPDALRALADYPFPGNVRELQNLVTRFAIVPLDSTSSTISRAGVLSQLTLAHRILVVGEIRSDLPHEARCQMARQTLLECGGDPGVAARMLGISPRELFRLTTAMPRPRRSRGHYRSI